MDEIIDFHVHIRTISSTTHLHQDYTLSKLIEDQISNRIWKSVCFINPFVSQLLCPNNPRHKIRVLDSNVPGLIKLVCTTCGNQFYHGIDPIREVNIDFLNQVKETTSIVPFVYLNVCASNINEEVDFYEKTFPNLIAGYKIHPTLSNRSIAEINLEATKKPILIHTGVEQCANPKNVLKFAENYKGNVILAHLARFSEEILMQLGYKDNLYVDTSPMTFLYELLLHKPNRLHSASWIASTADSCEEFYSKLFSRINQEKILFATDAPFSDCTKEIEQAKRLPLSCLSQWYKNASELLK